MQIKDVRPEPFVKQIRCDRCDRLAEVGETEFHEVASIDLRAGYGSIFGDGSDVQIDLCQHCLKAVLGPWLRVSDPEAGRAKLSARLSLFDPDRHGGEFPTAADASLQVPDDLPVQVRQSEFVRRGKEAIARSEASGDGIPSEVVLAKLAAKLDEARQRRKVGFLKGRVDVPANFDDALPSDMLDDFEGRAKRGAMATLAERTQSDPLFAAALLGEAIELARSGEPGLAKAVLCALVDAFSGGASQGNL